MADAEFRYIYAEEARKKDIWLQLVQAREAAGLTQQVAEPMDVSRAQVVRIEKRDMNHIPCARCGALLTHWGINLPLKLLRSKLNLYEWSLMRFDCVAYRKFAVLQDNLYLVQRSVSYDRLERA